MNGKLFRCVMKSLIRRKGELIRVVVATFISVFFVTGVLTFESNMYYWQMASNKERFGSWFVMQNSGDKPNEGLSTHPYLTPPVTAVSVCNLLNENSEPSGYKIGCLSDDFMAEGHITLLSGDMPVEADEVAVDMATLLKMGFSTNVGDTITLHYLDRNNDNKETFKDYKLTGILRSYSNIWASGKMIPSIVVSEAGKEALNMKMSTVYAYGIKDYVKTDDYRGIYENNLSELVSEKLYYNSDVYDYKPWGSPIVYNYMYILVVVIGVVTIAYQLMGYHQNRRKSLRLMNLLGAGRKQTAFITMVENMFMLVPVGLLGVGTAFVIGKFVCMAIEKKMGIMFYHVEMSAVIKGLLSILIALAVWEVLSLILSWKEKMSDKANVKRKKRAVTFKAPKRTIANGNTVWRMHLRFVRKSGNVMNLGIRIFYAAVCFVMTVCVIYSAGAYREYVRNNNRPDLVGFQQDLDSEYYYIMQYFNNYIENVDVERFKNESEYWCDVISDYWDNAFYYRVELEYDEYNEILNNGECIGFNSHFFNELSDSYGYYEWNTSMTKHVKNGNNNIYEGFTDEILQDLENIPGVDNMKFSSVETQRILTWENMDFEKMRALKLRGWYEDSSLITEYKNRYLFETNYVIPDKETYKTISRYMDWDEAEYDAWANGEQVLVIINDNPDGEYDDTLKTGDVINYHYTDIPVHIGYNGQVSKEFPYHDAFYELGMNTSATKAVYKYLLKLVKVKDGYGYMVPAHTFRTQIEDKKIGYSEKETMDNDSPEDGADMDLSDFIETIDVDSFEDEKAEDDLLYKISFSPCVAPKAAGVIYLDDSVREALKDIVVDYGYYTIVASDALAKKACESQNQLIADCLEMRVEDLPQEVKCVYTPNEVSIQYTLSSAVSATSNIVEAYCRNLGIIYGSNTEEKLIYRSQTINAFLQYGITFLAVFIVTLLISTIITKSRFERRKKEYMQMLRLGADRKMLVKICMLELLREDLWCILLLPFLLAMQLGMCIGMLRKLYVYHK